MAAVSHVISSLLNGISQQAAIARAASQLEAQEDCLSDLVNGLSRRPPLKHRAKLSSTPNAFANASLEFVKRDATTRYVIIMTASTIQVFDLVTGAAQTVNTPNGVGYLSCADPKTQLKCITVEDYTFIVNTTVTCAMGSAVAPGTRFRKTYPDVSTLADSFGPAPDPYNPPEVYRIVPLTTNSLADGYYVHYNQTAHSGGTSYGEYVEVAAPGVKTEFDPATMPHVLVPSGGGVFTFKEATWQPRLCGDLVSVPEPSFIGKTIADLFFAYGRFGWVTGNKLNMSRGGGDYFNFWRAKAAQVVATDPIDVTIDSPGVAGGFHTAIGGKQNLLVWSENAQYAIVSSSGAFGPNTVDQKPLSSYINSPLCRPTEIGDALLFTTNRHEWAQLSTIDVQINYQIAKATSVVEHVPAFIPKDIVQITGSAADNIIAVRSLGAVDAIYAYSHLEAGGEAKQTSWSRWNLPGGTTIAGMAFVDSQLAVVSSRADGAYLEYLDMAPSPDDGLCFYKVHLDRRLDQTQVTTVFSAGVSTFTLPYAIPVGGGGILLVEAEADPAIGVSDARALTYVDSTHVSLAGDWSARNFFIGLPYASWFELSEQFAPMSPSASDTRKTAEGILTLGSMVVGHKNTASLSGGVWVKASETEMGIGGGIAFSFVTPPDPVVITPPAVPSTALFRTTGKRGPSLNTEGTSRIPVNAKSTHAIIRFGSVAHMPFYVLGLRWEGQYTSTKQRV